MTHAHGQPFSMLVLLALAAAIFLAYIALALRGDRWSRWRIAAFSAGSLLLALGLLPQLLPFDPGDFRQHMLQHLLLGMLAPIGLVMGAPLTLVLRGAPRPLALLLARLMRSRLAHLLLNPATGLVLDLGGMAALYFTPLYPTMMAHPWLHFLVHLHFIMAGCLYSWIIAGPDPASGRLSVPARLVVLGIAVVIHSVLAQMLYAGILVTVPAPPDELRHAAVLMYYGGDIAEMILAFALVTTWRPERRVRGQTPA